MADDSRSMEELRRLYPELSSDVLTSALNDSNHDWRVAAEALKAKYYSDDKGIDQEAPFWAPLLAPFMGERADGSAAGGSWKLQEFGESVINMGAQLAQLAAVLPDLLFGDDEASEYELQQEKAKLEEDLNGVVASGSSASVKRRGTGSASKPAGAAMRTSEDEGEEGGGGYFTELVGKED